MLYANNIYMPATILNHFQLLLTVLCAPRVVTLLYSTCSRHLCDESVPSSHWTVKHLHGGHGLMFCLSPVPRNAWHILSIQKKNELKEVFASLHHPGAMATCKHWLGTVAPSESKHLKMPRHSILKHSIQDNLPGL